MKKLYIPLICRKLKNQILDFKISTKITLFYFILVICTLLISVFLYEEMHINVMSDKIQEVSIQTLYSIKSNINSTVENVNNFSKMFIMDDDVRKALKSNNIREILPADLERLMKNYNNNGLDGQKSVSANQYSTPEKSQMNSTGVDKINLSKHLNHLIEVNPLISSVFITDLHGFYKGIQADKLSKLSLDTVDIKEANWYNEVIKRNGGYYLSLNAGGIFHNKSNDNFISLIRVLRDIDEQNPIGILILNISDKAFVDTFKGVADKSDIGIMLLDQKNNIVASNENVNKLQINEITSQAGDGEYFSSILNIDNKEYLQSYLHIKNYDWKILSVMPFEEISKESKSFSFIAFIIILINGIMLFLGAVFISRMITTPIKKLTNAMKGLEKREFKMVELKPRRDEIGKLREGYNIMVSEIQNLIHQTVEEQKVKRKAELNILQAQVKPHFLYNTLDAMGYLALAGRNEEVYEALEALGSYYRTSLSKGKEVITIKEEIEIVKSYLILQNIRYGDVFSAVYEIDERAYSYKTLKLVLQPLVENALYHGIKPKGEPGIIKVSASLNDDHVLISVEDDGVGMSQEELDSITNEQLDSNSTSFGLKGTIKRLQIFYGITDIYSIDSKKRYGTKITISIPLERGVNID